MKIVEGFQRYSGERTWATPPSLWCMWIEAINSEQYLGAYMMLLARYASCSLVYRMYYEVLMHVCLPAYFRLGTISSTNEGRFPATILPFWTLEMSI